MFRPEEVSIVIQLADKNVTGSCTGEAARSFSWVKIDGVGEFTGDVNILCFVQGNPIASVKARSAYNFCPAPIPICIQFADQNVIIWRKNQTKIVSRRIDVSALVQCNLHTNIRGGSSRPSHPKEVSTAIQLADKDVTQPEAGQFARPRSRVEVSRIVEVSRGEEITIFVNGNIIAIVWTGSAQAIRPEEVPIAIQFQDKDICKPRTGQAADRNARIKINRIDVDACYIDVAIRIGRDPIPSIGGGPSYTLHPDKVSVPVIFDDKNICEPFAGAIASTVARFELHGLGVGTGDIHISSAIQCDVVIRIMSRPCHKVCPDRVSTGIPFIEESILIAWAIGHKPCAIYIPAVIHSNRRSII